MNVRSRMNWNLEMLVFVERKKPEYPSKQGENQQQTQPTYDAGKQVFSVDRLACGIIFMS